MTTLTVVTATTTSTVARRHWSKAGYCPELAWSFHDYAETLLKRNTTGDRPQAELQLEEALAISTELGMRPLAL